MSVSLGHKSRYHFSDTAEQERDEMLMAVIGGIAVPKLSPICRIDGELAQRIGATGDIVSIGPVTLNKIRAKHGMVLDHDLALLYHGFLTGRVQQDTIRSLIVLFRDPRKPKRVLMAVVKAARDGAELVISTYHVCTGKKLKAALKKGAIVRDDGTW